MSLLSSLFRADTQIVGAILMAVAMSVHPVTRLLHDRRRQNKARWAVQEEETLAVGDNDDNLLMFCNVQGVLQTLPLPNNGHRVTLAIEGGGHARVHHGGDGRGVAPPWAVGRV